MALGGAGQYDKALEYFQKSLAIKLKRIRGFEVPLGAGWLGDGRRRER